MKNLDWTEKYRPASLAEIVGHGKAIEQLKLWAEQWKHGIPEQRAVVVYGKPGIGKTTVAHALSHDMGWEVIELNASDQRTADIIDKVAGSASKMSSFDRGKRLLIMDEADNIHGTADRGGEKAIIQLIKKTTQPIILIANELYNMSAGLRDVCKPIQFNSLSSRSIIPVLKRIAKAEGITCGYGVIEKLAQYANGDMRSAINDLQAIAQGKNRVELEDIVTGDRDIKENIFKVLVKIFRGKDIIEAHNLIFNLDESPEDFIYWVDENLPLQYQHRDDLGEGYRYLAKASVYLGRVKKRQNYNMWRYASIMMTSGIVVARSHRYSGFIKLQSPSLWRKLGHTRSLRQIRDSTSKKIAKHCHVSMSFTRSNLIPFFRLMLKNNEYAPKVAALLGLEPEEIAYLINSKITKKVQRIYDEARVMIEKQIEQEIELFGGFEKKEVKVKKEIKSQSSLFDF